MSDHVNALNTNVNRLFLNLDQIMHCSNWLKQ